jgi:Arc/MetJ-type ribon-helix-helix transcriptional regulator
MAQSPIHITLSDEAAVEFVRSKVSSGEYASEADVIQEGLDALKDQAEERDRWEREVLMPAHNRLTANPSSAISLEEVEKNLEAKRRQRLKAS